MQTTQTRTRTIAAVLQILFALAYLISPLAGLVFGADVQAAAEAELARQGQPPGLLAGKGLHFDEGGYALVLPVSTAAIAAILAWLNLRGSRWGRRVTLVAQPLFLLLDVFIFTSQLSKTQYLQDILGPGVDAQAVIDASERAYPTWLFALSQGRIFFTLLASVAVIVLILLGQRGRKAAATGRLR